MKQLCQETLERAYLLLDGEGSPAERAEIQNHLEACSPCYERYGLNVEVKRIIARLQGSTPCPEGLRMKISEMLQSR